MSEKSISNRSLAEIMELSDSDIAEISKDEIVRDVVLQFSAGHAEVTKRLNKNKKKVQSILLNMEHFNVNELIGAACAVENEEKILEILTKRFSILFPAQKLDILG